MPERKSGLSSFDAICNSITAGPKARAAAAVVIGFGIPAISCVSIQNPPAIESPYSQESEGTDLIIDKTPTPIVTATATQQEKAIVRATAFAVVQEAREEEYKRRNGPGGLVEGLLLGGAVIFLLFGVPELANATDRLKRHLQKRSTQFYI